MSDLCVRDSCEETAALEQIKILKRQQDQLDAFESSLRWGRDNHDLDDVDYTYHMETLEEINRGLAAGIKEREDALDAYHQPNERVETHPENQIFMGRADE